MRDFEKEREYQQLLKKLEETETLNDEEESKVEKLEAKLEKMEILKRAMIATELQLRQSKALRARKESGADSFVKY